MQKESVSQNSAPSPRDHPDPKKGTGPVTLRVPSPFSGRGLGILLIQLGTPDAPTPQALRPYLKQFLSDPRIIEVPAWKWRIILNLFILPRRPAQSAAKYRRIWDATTGSPLLHYTRLQTAALQKALLVDNPMRLYWR